MTKRREASTRSVPMSHRQQKETLIMSHYRGRDFAATAFIGACAIVSTTIVARTMLDRPALAVPTTTTAVVVNIGDAGYGDPTPAEVDACASNGPIDGEYAAINENEARTAWICEIGG